MTTAQLQVLKTNILANLNTVAGSDTISNHMANSNWQAIADYYNSVAVPAKDLCRPDVSNYELAKNIVMSAYVTLTAVRQNGFMVYLQSPILDATSQNIRDGFTTIFGAGSQTVINLTALAKKPATYFEVLFIGSIVSGAYISTVYKYEVTAYNVQETTTI